MRFYRLCWPLPVLLAVACGCGGTDPLTNGETWDAIFMQGSQMGHVHTRLRRVERDGQPLLEVEAQQILNVRRFGDQTQPGVRLKSLETLDGKLLSFECTQQMGPTEQSSRGEVKQGELAIETATTGKTATHRIPWSDDYGGFFAMEHSLLRQPLQPGQQRTVKALAPVFNQLVTYECSARSEEETKLLDGPQKLLKIDAVMTLPSGGNIRSVVWTDRRGQIMKMRIDALSQETYRTTKERALSGGAAAGPDLGLATIVRLEKTLPQAHQTRRVRYEIAIDGEPGVPDNDPSKVFPSGPGQQVKSIGPNRAHMTVSAVRPLEKTAGPARAASSLAADLEPNNIVQSDAPRVVQMAREGAGGETQPLQIALALERYVHDNVRNKNFTQALATAADVAQTREGDCTEHAVLLAALARANKVPARVAIGLVYVEGLQGFGYHMWAEFYLDNAWIPFDATLGQGGIGAAHLKLADTNLAGGDALSAFLPVAKVLGRLKIKVLEVE